MPNNRFGDKDWGSHIDASGTPEGIFDLGHSERRHVPGTFTGSSGNPIDIDANTSDALEGEEHPATIVIRKVAGDEVTIYTGVLVFESVDENHIAGRWTKCRIVKRFALTLDKSGTVKVDKAGQTNLKQITDIEIIASGDWTANNPPPGPGLIIAREK